MSAPIVPRSADKAQIHFSDYLRNASFGNDPPVSIKARDLDTNFTRATIITPKADPPPYRVEYTKDGTVLKDIAGLPPDALAKQIAVCENGQTKLYYFIVWEEKPTLPSDTQ
jgi:hypothetical protein